MTTAVNASAAARRVAFEEILGSDVIVIGMNFLVLPGKGGL
jgi:hypothetical protein